jgi:hypothetical protein
LILERGQTRLPLLTPDQAKALARIILCDEARRPGAPARGGHPKSAIVGKFVSYSGKCRWRRGSDLVERIYAAAELLKRSALSDKEATSEVADLLGPRIGRSKRGRPPQDTVCDDLQRRAQIVRSLCNHFRKRHPWNEALPQHDPVVERWFANGVSLASWSERFLRFDEAFLKEPRLKELRSTAETISVWAKQLRDIHGNI